MKSHEILRDVVESVGAKQIAFDLRVSTSLVYKWCCEDTGDDATGARNPLDRLVSLCESARDRRPIEWLCQRFGGFFVESAEFDPDMLNQEHIKHTQGLLAEFSELLQVISESIANEDRIDAKEAAEIRRQWNRLQGQGEAFVQACERGLFDPSS